MRLELIERGRRQAVTGVAVVVAGLMLALAAEAEAYIDYQTPPIEAALTAEDRSFDATLESLEPTAAERWPNSFAGAWLGPKGLRGGVYVAFTKDAAAKVNELSADFAEPERLVVVEAKRSLADLEAQQDQMIADREKLAAGEESPAGLTDPDYTLDIDIEKNQAVLMTPESLTDSQRQSISDRYGPGVRIIEGVEPPVDLSCGSRENCEPLRAGLWLVFYNSNNSENCSSGFVAKRNGVKQVLSAGHCTSGSTNYNAANGVNAPFGSVGQSATGQRADALRAGVTEPGIGARGWVFQNQDHKGRQVSNVNQYANLMVGTPVGKSGYQSFMTWGAITSKYFATPGYYDLITADVFADFGDSGGSLTKQANWAAVGILKGYVTDPEAPQLGDTVYSHVQFVENRLGVNIITNDSG